MLFKPIIRVGPLSSAASREQTLTIGSPKVFQTAPPQPASNARSTIEPIFVGGALASQKGLGDLMPAKLMLRSAIFFYALRPSIMLNGDFVVMMRFSRNPAAEYSSRYSCSVRS